MASNEEERTIERIDINVPNWLLKELEVYQVSEDISNRYSAVFELIRIGLKRLVIKIRGIESRYLSSY